jgi:predicted  nucleic acid-binding Zn-ribbon protein
MDVSLRKANSLQQEIQDTIKKIEAENTITINEFQDPVAELHRANEAFFKADSRKQKLLLALYNIRGLVGTANAQSGINMSLAKAAFMDKRITQLESLTGAKPHLDIGVITGRIEKLRNRKEDSGYFGREEGVVTSIFSQDQIDQAKGEVRNLKKQKQKINDEVLELNIKTEIPLSEDTVITLKAEGIL